MFGREEVAKAGTPCVSTDSKEKQMETHHKLRCQNSAKESFQVALYFLFFPPL